MNDSIFITLKTPLQIATKDGQRIDVDTLEVLPPTMQNYSIYAGVKSVVSDAMMEMQNKVDLSSIEADSENSEEGNEDNTFGIDIFASTGKLMPLSKAINSYLLQNGKLDGQAVKELHLKRISITDYNKILGMVSHFLYKV